MAAQVESSSIPNEKQAGTEKNVNSVAPTVEDVGDVTVEEVSVRHNLR